MVFCFFTFEILYDFSIQDIVKSLAGDYRAEHMFPLKQAVELFDFYHQKIEACDRQIENCLVKFDSKLDINTNPVYPSKKANRKRRHNEHKIDLHTHL